VSEHWISDCPKGGCRDCRSVRAGPLHGRALRDGGMQRQMKCPDCGTWADIDDDQYFGKVSMECGACDYHETINLHREGLDIGYRR
jgi:hypothetical protein